MRSAAYSRYLLVAAAFAAFAALTLTACTDSPDPGPSPARPGGGNSRPVAGQNCGSERISLDRPEPADARRCFLDAVAARRVASLKSTVPTTEGDPIVYFLASDQRGTITVVMDTSQDGFRGTGVPPRTRYVCASLDPVPRMQHGIPDDINAHLHGCGTPTPF
ncbi:DUF4362 domain-containing protein [Frankia sp. Ag45/Mut15]|uniref:DUF4362 domain-containing protein n=1 Tax=Frankia umida TaxID=573489 RepID=A0ABT0K494_9ACTN|nr:DUF4362 domain-containing protein [Frankia umida]MCK9878148.1 DUF4362 domain-containing protein [Frankia umida]